MIFKVSQNTPVPPEKLSEKAVAFGQHIVELEEALAQAREQLTLLNQRSTAAEQKVAELREEKNELRRERDTFQKLWLETQTKLRTAGSIILDAIAPENLPPTEKFRARPASMRAVDKALNARASEPASAEVATIPAFLAAGPKAEVE